MGCIVADRKSIAIICIILLLACFIVVNTIILCMKLCVDIYLQFPLSVQILYFSNIIGRICFSTQYVNFQIKCLNGLKTKLESSYNRQWKIVTICVDTIPTIICVVWVYNLLSTNIHFANLHENCTFPLIFNVIQLVLFLPISFWGFLRSIFFLL